MSIENDLNNAQESQNSYGVMGGINDSGNNNSSANTATGDNPDFEDGDNNTDSFEPNDDVDNKDSDADTDDSQNDYDDDEDDNRIEDDEEEVKKDNERPRKKKNSARSRINQITREKYELKKRLEQYELKEMQQRQQQQNNSNVAYNAPNVNSQIDLTKPNPDAYEDYEGYIDALTDWKINQREHKARQQQEQNEYQRKVSSYEEQEKKAIDEIDDYLDVIENNRAMVNDAVPGAILESQYGARIRYYLLKNPNEAQKTLQMSPVEAIKFVGKIEAKIENDLNNSRKRRVSKAPAPIKPIRPSSGGNTRFDLNDEKTSIEEWMRQRNRQ